MGRFNDDSTMYHLGDEAHEVILTQPSVRDIARAQARIQGEGV